MSIFCPQRSLTMEELNANGKDYGDYNWSASSSLFPPLSEAPKFVSDSRKEDSLAENTQAAEKGLPPQEPAPGSNDFQRLKGEQKLAYDIVRTHHRFSPRKADDSCRPLRMIVCGSAGTGKSFLIKCLCDLLGSQCLLSAPTGVAAFNIGGKRFTLFCDCHCKRATLPILADRLCSNCRKNSHHSSTKCQWLDGNNFHLFTDDYVRRFPPELTRRSVGLRNTIWGHGSITSDWRIASLQQHSL